MGQVAKTVSAEQKFIEGRQGFLIPEVDTAELSPREFLQFFRDTLNANLEARSGRKLSFYYSRAYPFSQRFVLPSSEDHPLVLMQYEQSGWQNSFGDKATHDILVEPKEPGDFEPFLQINHPVELQTLTVSPASGGGLTFYSRGGTTGEFGEGSPAERQNLGRVASDFVELVS
ncbi:MAG TPA: hypothetical protein VFK11_03730 [Candidatus Saccharimonadales bacterium]|nr:hypothetical protein [Candidatus Saccharimonadales bacterium]